MHFKLALLSGLAATASCFTYGQQGSYESVHYNPELLVNKQLVSKYIQPNIEEVCFSVRPVAVCDENHVSTKVKHQKVGFHCLESGSYQTDEYVQQVKNGQPLYFEQRSQDVEAYVEVPIHCELIQNQVQIWRKQCEQNYGQKIHLVQPQDTEQSVCSNNYLYQDQSDLTDSKYTFVEWNQYNRQYIPLQNVLTFNEVDYKKLWDYLKYSARQIENQYSLNGNWNQWNHQTNHVWPTAFGTIAQKFFTFFNLNKDENKYKTELYYDQYKEVVKRVYAYVIKQVIEHVYNNPYPTDYQNNWNHVARKIYNKIKQELTKQELKQVEKIISQYNENTVVNTDIFTVTPSNQVDWQSFEKHLNRILVSGLVLASKHHTEWPNVNNQFHKILSETLRGYWTN